VLALAQNLLLKYLRQNLVCQIDCCKGNDFLPAPLIVQLPSIRVKRYEYFVGTIAYYIRVPPERGDEMENLNVFIGCLTVVLVAGYRFNVTPPPEPSLPAGVPRRLGMILNWFQLKKDLSSSLFPPPRANTTLFKFWLYRAAYALISLLIFIALLKVPKLAEEVQKIINIAAGSNTPVLKNAGPIVMAFFAAVVFPMLPPFKEADRSLRRCLFERASIPAQQLRERNRLKKAEYEAKPEELKVVKSNLQTDGFDASDIVYEVIPTTQSLWTKASLLMEHIAAWQAKDQYKTAFALLKERDSDLLSVDRVAETYEALKGNARECFAGKRSQPGALETQKREEAFRGECKELLIAIYDLLSRVSLKSHFNDRERVNCAKEIGFKLKRRIGGPVPDSNDLIALALVLAGACLLPLSTVVGPGRAVMITVIIFAAVLIPILIADRFPKFAFNRNGYSPSVAYPFASGLTAAVITVTISIAYSSISFGDIMNTNLVDFGRGWSSYISRSYPWTALPVLYAVLIAWRIRTGSYPDTDCLKGFRRYCEWGCLLDAGIFLVCTVGVMVIFVMPRVSVLWQKPDAATDWMLLIRPALVSSALGFLVPTWYRANALRLKQAASAKEFMLNETGSALPEVSQNMS